MRPGDIVKVKRSGKDRTGPEYGIYLGQEKGDKVHLFKVFNGSSTLKLRRKAITPVEGTKRFGGEVSDQRAMKRFLAEAGKRIGIRDEEQTNLEMTPQEIIRTVSIHDLWNSIVKWSKDDEHEYAGARDEASESSAMEHDEENDWGYLLPEPSPDPDYLYADGIEVATLGAIHFHPKELTKGQTRAIEEILEPCKRSGMPYFRKGKGRGGQRYSPYSPDALQRVDDHIARLKDLKGRFVEWTIEETESEEGEGKDGKKTEGGRETGGRRDRDRRDRRRPPRRIPNPIHEDPSTVELSSAEHLLMDELFQWARNYFIQGGWNEVTRFGLGGTPMTHLEKFSLPKFLEFFGTDLAGERALETPSALMEFLLRMKQVSWKEASELFLIHKVTSKEAPFFLDFPQKVLLEAATLPEEPGMDEFVGRTDLREQECYTIDPPDARDFDDAIGFRQYTDPIDDLEKIELNVHIADVTHYVIEGQSMDDDARRRCTSAYLPTGVLPMLPRELSENLCSLRGGVPRLAFSTKMIFDANTAELLEWEHERSVVNVRENLSYDHVNDVISGDPDSLFSTMWKFAQKLEERSERLGIVTKERKIRFDPDEREQVNVQLKSPSPATRMIEQFMVVTNEAVARTIHEAGIPSVYRIHPLPNRTDVERWNAMCLALGHEKAKLDIDFDSLTRSSDGPEKEGKSRGRGSSIKTDDVLSMLKAGGTLSLGGFGGPVGVRMKNEEKNDLSDEADDSEIDEQDHAKNTAPGIGTGENLAPMDPEDLATIGAGYRKALQAISEMKEGYRDLLYQRILSTMPRAVYSVNNHGHFGLNSLCYTHFTSPIRRYPDVLVHRILGDIVRGRGFTETEKKDLRADLEIMTDICNDQTRAAEDLERGMIDIALATKASQDRDFRSKAHSGRVTGLTPTSCFINIDGVTEARIPLSRLSSIRLSLDESESRIIADEHSNDEVTIHNELKKLKERGFGVGGKGRGELGTKKVGIGELGTEKMRMGEVGNAKVGIGEGGSRRAETVEHTREAVSETPLPEGIEIIRLGQTVSCRIRSVELSAGKVDLTLSS